MQEFLFALWFFLPAGIANAAPVFAARIKALDSLGKPIDHGKTRNGKQLLGDHKTYRGFISGVIAAVITVTVQMIVFQNSSWIRSISGTIDYSEPSILILGLLLGFGALFGDSVKSFFKRQMSVPSGKSWFPFDQIDYIIGGILFSVPYILLPILSYALVLIIWLSLHVVVVYLGWLLKIRDAPI